MISFAVYGVPVAQGSMVAFMLKHMKRPILHASNDNQLKKWRKAIGTSAALALRGASPAGRAIPIRVTALFVLPQPKSSKYADCVKAPDLDKLLRALLDAMTGVVFDDDAQVAEIHSTKEYGPEPRLEVFVEEITMKQEMLRLVPAKETETPF